MAIGNMTLDIKTTIRFKRLLVILNSPIVMLGFKPWVPRFIIKCEITKPKFSAYGEKNEKK